MATTPPIIVAGITLQFVNDGEYHLLVGDHVVDVAGSPVVIRVDGATIADLGALYQAVKAQLAEAGAPPILP